MVKDILPRLFPCDGHCRGCSSVLTKRGRGALHHAPFLSLKPGNAAFCPDLRLTPPAVSTIMKTGGERLKGKRTVPVSCGRGCCYGDV